MSAPNQPFENDTKIFLHCRECLASIPNGQSPREWARIEVGITESGEVQVWCQRHEKNIVRFSDPVALAAQMGMQCANPIHKAN